jgi:hypothetical protein
VFPRLIADHCRAVKVALKAAARIASQFIRPIYSLRRSVSVVAFEREAPGLLTRSFNVAFALKPL